ncbi:MAG: hypothetical protein V1808_04010 [Candidatus Daviesbacteria bacterium]
METEKTITIPGRPEEVELSRVHGDISSGISFELSGQESYLSRSSECDHIKDLISRGGRVFVTEDDEYLFIEPKTHDKL